MLALVRVRYKLSDSDTSALIEEPVLRATMVDRLAHSSDCYRFAAAVAGSGQLLRCGKYTGTSGYDDVLELARAAAGMTRSATAASFCNW